MSGGCERPVVVAVDGQRRRVSLVGLKGELSKEVVDSELCRKGAMAVPEIRSCQRRQPPELRCRTTWRCLVERPGVVTVNGRGAASTEPHQREEVAWWRDWSELDQQ